MPRNENYPPDIRNFDNVPGSPYYVDPMDAIEDARDELVQKWQAEYVRTGKVEWLGGDPHDEMDKGETLGEMFDRMAMDEVNANPDRYITDNEKLNWG